MVLPVWRDPRRPLTLAPVVPSRVVHKAHSTQEPPSHRAPLPCCPSCPSQVARREAAHSLLLQAATLTHAGPMALPLPPTARVLSPRPVALALPCTAALHAGAVLCSQGDVLVAVLPPSMRGSAEGRPVRCLPSGEWAACSVLRGVSRTAEWTVALVCGQSVPLHVEWVLEAVGGLMHTPACPLWCPAPPSSSLPAGPQVTQRR